MSSHASHFMIDRVSFGAGFPFGSELFWEERGRSGGVSPYLSFRGHSSARLEPRHAQALYTCNCDTFFRQASRQRISALWGILKSFRQKGCA